MDETEISKVLYSVNRDIFLYVHKSADAEKGWHLKQECIAQCKRGLMCSVLLYVYS